MASRWMFKMRWYFQISFPSGQPKQFDWVSNFWSDGRYTAKNGQATVTGRWCVEEGRLKMSPLNNVMAGGLEDLANQHYQVWLASKVLE